MKYVFEKGAYPRLDKQVVVELNSNLEAVEYAKKNGYEYVWDAPDDRNPSEVYSVPGRYRELSHHFVVKYEN